MQFQFRKARQADLEKLRTLDNECFPSDSLDLQPAAPGELEAGIDQGEISVAVVDSEIVGLMQLQKSRNGWELKSLAIGSGYRGMGLGKIFLSQLKSQWITEPVSVSCVTSPNNLAMRSLLEKFGFREQQLLPDYFGPGKHRLLYRLNPS